MSQKLKIQKGDSCRIAVVFPLDRMDRVEEIVCGLGNFYYRKSDGSLKPTVDPNIFLINLTSKATSRLNPQNELTIAIDYSDLGVKKTGRSQNLILEVERNANDFINASISELTSATVTVTIVEQTIDASIQLGNYLKGDKGAQGWTPILAVVEDGLRRVHQVVDWTGSTGTKPVTGLYVGATGLVANIADAKDIRGAQGIQGEKGVIITTGSTYTPTTIHVLTQAEYNALTPIVTTLYFIV